MTHDELLAKLTPTQERGFPSNPITVLNTLRAVVELHKPVLWQKIEMVCEDCGEQNYNSAYPCLTIQAIEKAIE